MQKRKRKSRPRRRPKLKRAAKAMQESKAKHPDVTVIQVTPEQWNAFVYMGEDPENMVWVDKVSEKYGEWRPAKPDEKGIPCDIELKKAG